MRKLADIFKGEHKWFTLIMTGITLLFLIPWLVGPGNTIIHWIQTKQEIASHEKQMEFLRQEIEKMDQNIEELENNRDTLEKFARERFKFAAPGEDVYIIE